MAKNHKLVMAQGIIKYAAEAHHCFSAAYHSRNEDELYEKARIRMAAHHQWLKEHDVNWQRQKERARASDQKYHQNTYTVKDEPAAFFLSLKCPRGEAHREKAAVIAQEVAVDEEQAKRKEALMDWTQEWVAKKHGTQHAPRAPLRVALCGVPSENVEDRSTYLVFSPLTGFPRLTAILQTSSPILDRVF
ncbi:hypothetical protein DFH08DRAFT_808929 [Mycena albidolilacea]|uniref:Uncharacterized protein n=1 Tax=Mycena albidolilacea TaxID=1033008 RepID=A0AAD7ETI5_9AGAR|nr:hypothetical protein DFH08DRAFT_808929 [Mycena albidolilacea]